MTTLAWFMELFCNKCERTHIRPVGRRCYKEGMATNITSTQPSVAPNAFLTQQLAGRPPSPIEGLGSSSSVTRNVSTSLTVTSNTGSQQTPRTEELILAELQKLSTRITLVEQELQAETFTPRKRKRVRAGGHAEDSSLAITGNRTDVHTSLDESASVSRRTGGVRIPVHTQSHTNTTTTVSSLFTQGGQRSSQPTTANVSQPGLTQTVFSTCHSAHQYSHVRAIQQGPATLLGTQGLPQATTGPQGVRLVNTRASGPIDLYRMATTTGTHSVTFNPVIASTTHLGHSSTGLHQQPQAPHSAQQILIHPPGGAHMMSQNHHQPQNTVEQHTATPSVNQDQPIIPSIQALRTTAVNQDLVQQRLQSQRSKLGFYVPFNIQGHIGTGPQNCHLWDSNPQRWQPMIRCQTC